MNLPAPKAPHRPTKVKSWIFLSKDGGPSQMDLFDDKPEMQKRDGKTVNLEVQRNDVKPGKLLGSMRQGAQHGQSGWWDQQQNWDAYHGVEENLQIHSRKSTNRSRRSSPIWSRGGKFLYKR